MIKRAPFVAVLLTLSSVPAFAAGGMQPGLWEVTTRMQMAGMPMPPQTVRHCYTRQDVEKGERTVPQADDKNCKIKDYKLKGNTATWSIVCTGKNAMTGTGACSGAMARPLSTSLAVMMTTAAPSTRGRKAVCSAAAWRSSC